MLAERAKSALSAGKLTSGSINSSVSLPVLALGRYPHIVESLLRDGEAIASLFLRAFLSSWTGRGPCVKDPRYTGFT